MDSCKTTGKIKIKRIHQIQLFTSALLKLNTTELVNRLKLLTNQEIGFICEIVTNFLCGNITVNSIKLRALHTSRHDLHKLVSKTTSNKTKKNLINSLIGLNIVKILLPYANNTLKSQKL